MTKRLTRPWLDGICDCGLPLPTDDGDVVVGEVYVCSCGEAWVWLDKDL